MTIHATFQDYLSVNNQFKDKLQEFKDYYASGGTKKLIVDMEATHSGVPLNNPRFYIPSRMREGTSTINVGESPMKILKHHDSYADPVGKALYREYVDTIPADLVNNSNVLVLLSDTATMKQQIKAMRNLKRDGILDREGYKGLGYIKLQAEVSDLATVKQLEDGLFDAVSTNFDSPNEVYCSICGENLYTSDSCLHEIGESYYADGMEETDDMKFICQAIPGKHIYKEASFINFKGDQHASVKIIDTKNADNNQTIYVSKDSVQSGHSTFQFKDSVEEDNMKINGEEVTLSDTEQEIFDMIKKINAEATDEDIFAQTKEVISVTSSDEFIANIKEIGLDHVVALKYAIEAIRSKDEEINRDFVCDEMRKELEAMKEEGLISEDELAASTAKITHDKTLRMPDSLFCGPARSFPVLDSAHAIAVKRMIDRYTGFGNKVSILVAVSIKEKTFIPETKDEAAKNDGKVEILPISADSLKAMSTEELRTIWHQTELELIGRKQVLVKPCSDCAVKEKETEIAKKELGEARDSLADSENIVKVLRNELKRSYSDYEAQIDDYVALGAQINKDKIEKLALIGVLSQKYDTLENAISSLKDCDLSREEPLMMDSFNIEEASLKINDGMARIPSGTITDPGQNTDGDNKQILDKLSEPALEAIENIKDYLKNKQIRQAKQIYMTMKSLGLFGDDLTFESLSVDSKDITD